jgi:hypothetical protein
VIAFAMYFENVHVRSLMLLEDAELWCTVAGVENPVVECKDLMLMYRPPQYSDSELVPRPDFMVKILTDLSPK